MQTSVSKWGNSLAIRLPRSIADEAHLVNGTPVELKLEGEGLLVIKTRKKYALSDLLGKFKPEHRHGEVDFGQSCGEEAW